MQRAAARRSLRVFAGRRQSDEGADRPMTYLWIAVGSAIGGVGRYWCAEALARLSGGGFPWGTLFVNVGGSFVIGLFFALTGPAGRFYVPAIVREFVMFGLLGGFTTFSSFSLQTLVLARDGQWTLAGINAGSSLLLCLAGAWLGHAAGALVR